MSMRYGRQFIRQLKREIRAIQRAAQRGWTTSMVDLRNFVRRARQFELDYVVMPIGGPLPERAAPPRSFIQRQLPLPPEPLSMQALNYRFNRIAQADNVRGVVLAFEGIYAGPATLQNLRQAIHRLRQAGKTVVVYTPYLDMEHYFAAAAADLIIAPPSADFAAVGVQSEAIFLKDALQTVGIEADIIQISPYKTGGNIVSESDITPEQREQLEWLLDEKYELMVTAVAADRGLTIEEMKAHIDAAPFNLDDALARGLIDKIGYQDDIAAWLAEPADELADEPADEPEDEPEEELDEELDEDEAFAELDEERGPRAKLRPWATAEPMLMEKPDHYHRRYVGVISVEGLIAMGVSRHSPSRLPIPLPIADGVTAGERTIIGLLREAEKDREVAAIVLHVDSPGGSALASDLIWRQVAQTQKKKPVLAYMGNVAASGGYYVSAPAAYIMSQPTTITGSIGVIMGRISLGGLYKKARINRVSLSRGEHAELYSDLAPLTEEERQIFFNQIKETYRRFQEVVIDGRGYLPDDIDWVCEGKVWSGRQALEFDLVDGHGDFEDAVNKAAELAEIKLQPDEKIGTINFYGRVEDGGLLGALLSVQAPGVATAVNLLNLLDNQNLAQLRQKPLYLLPFQIK
jgi:protease IV